MPKAIIVQPGGGFDRIVVGERDASPPEAGEITVRLRASSLPLEHLADAFRHQESNRHFGKIRIEM